MSNAISTIEIKKRPELGKGASRRVRREGLIPGVCYGLGRPTEQLAVSPKPVLAALSSELGRNTLLSLDEGGKKGDLALIKDVQRHPVTGDLRHVDFYRVDINTPVDVRVPVVTTGKAAGVVKGGELRIVFRTLPIRVKPDRVPTKITIDVTPIDVHGHVSVKDLPLPEGIEVLLPPAQSVITVEFRKKRSMDEPEAAPGAAAAAAPAAAAGAKAAS